MLVADEDQPKRRDGAMQAPDALPLAGPQLGHQRIGEDMVWPIDEEVAILDGQRHPLGSEGG